MVNVIEIDTGAVYCIGDIHGLFETFTWFIKSKDIRDSVLILCGDVNLGYCTVNSDNLTLLGISQVLVERNTHLIIVRGNHDNPSIYSNTPLQLRGIKNVTIVPDYTVVKCNDNGRSINILCVGGAISVDRTRTIKEWQNKCNMFSKFHPHLSEDVVKRSIRLNYWKDLENFVFDINKLTEITESGIKIDAVVTHTAPTFCFPVEKGQIVLEYMKVDPTLEKELNEERQEVSKLFDYLLENNHPIQNWCYGHFHSHASEQINGVLFTLLDCLNSRNNTVGFKRIF